MSTGNAFNAQLSYLFKNNYELTGRFTTVDFKDVTARAPQEQYTFGISKYIVGHKLKIQTDVSYSTVDGNEDFIAFRCGFDFHF